MSSTTELLNIFKAEQSQLQRLVRRLTGNPHSAEDVVHDTFIKLMHRDEGKCDVGLVVTTARNLARDAMRAERVRTSYAESVSREQVHGGVVGPAAAVSRRMDLDAGSADRPCRVRVSADVPGEVAGAG